MINTVRQSEPPPLKLGTSACQNERFSEKGSIAIFKTSEKQINHPPQRGGKREVGPHRGISKTARADRVKS